MRVTEESYEQVIHKILAVVMLQGTSEQAGYSLKEIEERFEDWFQTNAPIGAQALLDAAIYLDNFQEEPEARN